jgi:hypothetical protein
MPPTPTAKILRIGVIQGGKIIEERHLKRRDTVSIGLDAKNTIVVPASNLPQSFPVFEFRNGQYHLCFSESMEGRVRVGASDVDFGALRSQGLAKRRGSVFVLPLTDAAKGKISLGEVTLLFQFVTPQPEPARPELPQGIRGSPFQAMDQLFFGVLAASLVLHFSGAACIALSDKPPEHELSLDELPDRFAKVFIPQKPPEPVVEAKAAGDDEVKEEKKEKKDTGPKKTSAGTEAERKAAIAQKVASKGLLKILGSAGGAGGGALQDVLGGGGTGDIASALSGAGGVGIATADSLGAGGPKGGGSGNAASIGDLGTSGGGNVSLGSKGDAKISGRVRDAAPEVESSDVDREALARYVRQRIKAITGCYEKELKRNPSLKGKIVIRFSIKPSGRAEDIDIEENTLGSDAVASCIRAVIRGWIFPFKPSDDVPVAYPFVFSPAS